LSFKIGKVLTIETMHPLVKSVEYAVRGALPIRAEALSQVNDIRNLTNRQE
jgi:hypothetical protein